nr:MarR family transcriptional regulator [Thermophilibacter provencensis]
MGEDPVLEYISRQDEAMTPSELAKTLGYTRPRMTRIIDSLEEKGYVVREQDKEDRRRVLVYCTDEGRRHANDHSSDGVSSLAATLSKMGEHDARELLRGLEIAYSLTYDKDDILGGVKKHK